MTVTRNPAPLYSKERWHWIASGRISTELELLSTLLSLEHMSVENTTGQVRNFAGPEDIFWAEAFVSTQGFTADTFEWQYTLRTSWRAAFQISLVWLVFLYRRRSAVTGERLVFSQAKLIRCLFASYQIAV